MTSLLRVPGTVPARNLAKPDEEIVKAKAHFGRTADTPASTCYGAAGDGFWLALES
jgi:hypothetical protein